MTRRTHQTLANLLAFVLLCASAAPSALARQNDARKDSQPNDASKAAQTSPTEKKFSGSIFGGEPNSKTTEPNSKTSEPDSKTNERDSKTDASAEERRTAR